MSVITEKNNQNNYLRETSSGTKDVALCQSICRACMGSGFKL